MEKKWNVDFPQYGAPFNSDALICTLVDVREQVIQKKKKKKEEKKKKDKCIHSFQKQF